MISGVSSTDAFRLVRVRHGRPGEEVVVLVLSNIVAHPHMIHLILQQPRLVMGVWGLPGFY